MMCLGFFLQGKSQLVLFYDVALLTFVNTPLPEK